MSPSPTTLTDTRALRDGAPPPGEDRLDEDSTAADDRTCPPGKQLALLTAKASTEVPSAIRTARASSPAIAPFTTAVLHTPLTSASLLAIDPRARPAAIDRGEAHGQLDLERRPDRTIVVCVWSTKPRGRSPSSGNATRGDAGWVPSQMATTPGW